MSYTFNITKKGQVTIPKEFRDKLGLDKSRRATFTMNKQGEIVIAPVKSAQEIHDMLGKPGKKPVLSKREKLFIPQLVKKYGKPAR